MIRKDWEHFDYTVLSLSSIIFFHKTISQKVLWLEIPSVIKIISFMLQFIKRFNIFPLGGLFLEPAKFKLFSSTEEKLYK